MATERYIRKLVLKELHRRGWVTDSKPSVRYQSKDLFTIWDIIAWKGSDLLFIQFTTVHNLKARFRKITGYMKHYGLQPPCRCELWGYDEKNNKFKIVPIKVNKKPVLQLAI